MTTREIHDILTQAVFDASGGKFSHTLTTALANSLESAYANTRHDETPVRYLRLVVYDILESMKHYQEVATIIVERTD